MNLQELNEPGHSNEALNEQRNRHTIRFSQIDGAGIVYYPRYFEMLTESFPEQFSLQQAVRLDIRFHQPARLGDPLVLEPSVQAGEPAFSVSGRSGSRLCFEVHKTRLQKPAAAPWLNSKLPFVRQASIGEWMCGADARLHLSRSYELTAVLMEEWFSTSLLCPFATLQSPEGALVPTVRLLTDVYEMPRSGDRVILNLCVLHIGRSSLGMGMSIRRNEQLLLQSEQTVVFVASRDGELSSVEMPSQVRQRLQEQLEGHLASGNGVGD